MDAECDGGRRGDTTGAAAAATAGAATAGSCGLIRCFLAKAAGAGADADAGAAAVFCWSTNNLFGTLRLW
jgi:hypothetical protein